MTKILFIQGGGEAAHDWDARLARSLEEKLGRGYSVHFPKMPNEAEPNYPAWSGEIRTELASSGDGTVLVAHSIGASMVIKMLSEEPIAQSLRGIFLVAAPFIHEQRGWPWKETELAADAAARLPQDVPLFLYHGREDEEVPFAHLAEYAKLFPRAVRRELAGRNHQLNDDLTEVADDIRKLNDAPA